MTAPTRDTLMQALAGSSSRIVLDKASISNTATGQFHSLWRGTGQPGQAAIPGAAATCDDTTLGCFGFTQQTAPASSYLGWAHALLATAGQTLELHDRLMQMGGLNGTLTTAQTVNLDVHANIANVNLAQRIGDSNYSDIQWWLEWYTDTGATSVTATVAVTYNDGTSGNLTGVTLASTRRASFMQPLNNLIPAAAAGKFIRDVDSVTLSATTGAAGNFGVTATRPRAIMPVDVGSKQQIYDWAALGLPEIYNDTCLFPLTIAQATTTGIVKGGGKIAHV